MKKFLGFLFLLPMVLLGQNNFEKAEKLIKEGKLEQAKPLLENHLKSTPSHIKSIEYLGDIAGKEQDWEKALSYYKSAKKLAPKHADYYYKYGGVLGMMAKEANKFKALGMITEVKENFAKTLQLDPKHIEVRYASIELFLQLPRIIGGSEDKAIQYSDDLLKLSPIDGYLSRGHIEEYYKRYPNAEKQYKKAIQLSGSKTSYNKLISLYNGKMKQPQKAKLLQEEYNRKETVLK